MKIKKNINQTKFSRQHKVFFFDREKPAIEAQHTRPTANEAGWALLVFYFESTTSYGRVWRVERAIQGG